MKFFQLYGNQICSKIKHIDFKSVEQRHYEKFFQKV